MEKLNNKGYMLVEIIMAFAITFTLLYFMMDLVLKMKNNNDDLLVETVVKTDSTIITNRLMEHAKVDVTNQTEADNFCTKIKVDGKTVKYDGNVIAVVDDTATVGAVDCKPEKGRLKVKIPLNVKQMKDENFDVVIDYYYDHSEVCNPVTSYKCSNSSVGTAPYVIEYSGQCKVINDENGDWRIKFLTGGTLKVGCDMSIDAFLVGGGGGGGSGWSGNGSVGGGGGGGYTTTKTNYQISKDKLYKIQIGTGGAGGSGISGAGGTGGTSSIKNEAGTILLKAIGGKGGYSAGGVGTLRYGGDGGSGGGSGKDGDNGGSRGNGGTNGGNGSGSHPGSGQGTTTREFEEDDGTLYSTGGKGGGGAAGASNTGNGGGGNSGDAGKGGSGIVIFRKSASRCEGDVIDVNFTYTGRCEMIDDGGGKWRIKFLSSGELKFYDDLKIDTFLVGGGGGGAGAWLENGSVGGGGGGGYTTTKTNYQISKDILYKIQVGIGGTGGMSDKNGSDGGTSSIKNEAGTILLKANGGKGGYNAGGTFRYGGDGGSGGGSGRDGDNGGSTGSGGTNGGNGSGSHPGSGQGTTTREFEEDGGTLYSTGGNGGGEVGAYNTGNGGGGGTGSGFSGGSGIIIIRKK